MPKVRVFVVTYLRHKLLERALQSLIKQTYPDWIAEVLNDAPEDTGVEDLINQLDDPRIVLSKPAIKRGGTGNFNYAFTQHIDEDFACILEDDNWYHHDFLLKMIGVLEDQPDFAVAISNEKIWVEHQDGQWEDTNNTIWPIDEGEIIFHDTMANKCGFAKVCNSATMWRVKNIEKVNLPIDLPIDVTEHFRERILPHPFILINEPLVHFANTLDTNRSSNSHLWGAYQVLLVASVFRKVPSSQKSRLAEKLWDTARANNNPYKTTLLHTSLAEKGAFILLKKATFSEILRYMLTWFRRPARCYKIITAPKRYQQHFKFLLNHFDSSQLN
ncbi:glycosyltransferase family 2 protein [Pedobacter sandarakinus]|uniref:glycosyltransferase family 2 protein n=1 Tax=Pedobacter sandarakinus TaxID=353156 RepID=UPI002246B1C9|nr:glycosyltransferase [Pedobacter sandarakinus]MCX2575914.1 glycosyltransferase [Pedobacter sandarakinus]